jgi:hypothetical protein
MSEKTRKQDRRTRYTRQTIKDTFLELLNQKRWRRKNNSLWIVDPVFM